MRNLAELVKRSTTSEYDLTDNLTTVKLQIVDKHKKVIISAALRLVDTGSIDIRYALDSDSEFMSYSTEVDEQNIKAHFEDAGYCIERFVNDNYTFRKSGLLFSQQLLVIDVKRIFGVATERNSKKANLHT